MKKAEAVMVRVIGIGDNVCDKYEHLKTMFPGGQALNFSVYAKLLGADASYMGVFGTDEAAVHVIKTLDELGVEHGRCRQYEGENGCARVTLKDGDRIFLGSNKGGVSKEHPFELTEEDLAYISTFSLVHTSNNSYMDSQLEKSIEPGFPFPMIFRAVDRRRTRLPGCPLCILCLSVLRLRHRGGGQGNLSQNACKGVPVYCRDQRKQRRSGLRRA